MLLTRSVGKFWWTQELDDPRCVAGEPWPAAGSHCCCKPHCGEAQRTEIPPGKVVGMGLQRSGHAEALVLIDATVFILQRSSGVN